MTDEMHRAIGRLEGKLDAVLEYIQTNRQDMKSLDTRVDGLEKDQHTSKVLLSILAAGAGVLASSFPTIFGWLTSKS